MREGDGSESESCIGTCSELARLLGEFDEAEYHEFLRSSRRLYYGSGELIFQQGTPAKGLYLICSGRVELVRLSADKRERQVPKLLGPGEFLGEETLFTHSESVTYARTLKPSELCFMEKQDFLGFLERHPALTLSLIEKLSREVKAFQSKLVESTYENGEERLVRLLSAIGHRYGRRRRSQLEIELELGRAELAELAGLTTETTIRILQHLKTEGILVLSGRQIRIADEERLSRLVRPLAVQPLENII